MGRQMKKHKSFKALDQWTIERLAAWRAGDREAGHEVVRQYTQLAHYFLLRHIGWFAAQRYSELCDEVVHDALAYAMASYDPSRGSFGYLLLLSVKLKARAIVHESKRHAKQRRIPDGYDPPWSARDGVSDIDVIYDAIRRAARTPFQQWYAEHIIAGGDWQPAAVARILGEPRKRIAGRIANFRARVVKALRSDGLAIDDFLDG